MSQPVVAQKSPFSVEVREGRSYMWCAGGKSQKQPFCDGSHMGSDFAPVKYTAGTTQTVFFCGCKSTGTAPLCDGTHNGL